MESSEFYSELKAKGLLLANHDGKLRVGPKEKLTKGDRELLKVFKEELLALPAMKKANPESEHGVRCEPNSRVFYREKRHTDAEYMSSPVIKGKTNVHNVHDVHDVHATENFELRQLGSWFFSDNQAGFEDGGDYSEYDAGSNKSALRMQNMVRNLTWPDFEVSVDGSMIILKRVKERYFPRKNKDESSQLNDESSKQE
jgi:hypothetical protein